MFGSRMGSLPVSIANGRDRRKYRRTAVVLGMLLFAYQMPAIALPACAGSAPPDYAGPAEMERQGPDHSHLTVSSTGTDHVSTGAWVETSAPGHTLPAMACDVGTHCASTFPSPRTTPLMEAPLEIDDPGASMTWSLHTASPSHPTPPPKT